LRDNLYTQFVKVESIENDPNFNERLDNHRVSLDSGMIQLVEDGITTVNEIRVNGAGNCGESIRLEHMYRVSESFIMNTYTYVNELLARICHTLIWLSEYTHMVPLDLD
jgi:hypothetical protein